MEKSDAMTRRRAPQIVLVALVAGLFLPGCGASSAGTASRTLRIWYSTDDPVERAWSQELAGRFQAANPLVTVRLTDYSFEDLNTKLQLALNAGDPPDLAYVTPRGPGIPAYVGAHKLLDLSRRAASGRWAARLRPGLLESYNRPFGYQGAKKGAIVAVPTSLAAIGVLYNKSLLRRLGLSVSRSIPEFQKALAKAKASGLVPIGLGNADGWLGDDWYLTLANALETTPQLAPELRLDRKFSFERQPFQEAANILKTWSQAGYFTPEFGGLDAQEGVDAFFAGKTLFQLVSSSENAQIQRDERATRLPIGLFAFPTVNGGGVMPVAGYLGWVVPEEAANKGDAYRFINFLLQPGTSAFLASQGSLPSTRYTLSSSPVLVRQYQAALNRSRPGIYLDAAPIGNLNATMEANVQLLLQGYEAASFLPKSLEQAYSSRGRLGSTARIDGEF